jgi:hypothetical protein
LKLKGCPISEMGKVALSRMPCFTRLIEHGSNCIDLFVEHELLWTFGRFVAGIRIDVDRE